MRVSHIKDPFKKLKKVVLCKPINLRIEEPINEAMYFWTKMKYPPLVKDAIKQHENLTNILYENKVEPIFLKPLKSAPYQVFTRDLGFSPDGKNIILAQPKYKIRKEEVNELINKVKDNKNIISLPKGCIFEGGNILVYSPDLIFLGISERTNIKTLNELKELLPSRIVPVQLPPEVIHLDVVMNFANPSLAVVYENAIPQKIIEMLKKKLGVNIVPVNYLQMFTLATNFLVIKENVIIAAQENHDVNKILISEGVDVIETAYREIIKLGGSIRCSTLPLERG